MKLKYKKLNIPFDNYTFILNNQYYQKFVKNNLEYIKKNYNKYISCNNIKKLRKSIFICEVFHHALSTQHYYHIDNHGEKFNSVLVRYADMLTEIEKYVIESDFDYNVNNQYIEKYDFCNYYY